jgi:hypothetical protein
MVKKLGKKKAPITKSKLPVDNRRPDGTFGEGNIANPNGRPPKGYSLTEMLKQMIDERPNLRRDLMTHILDIALKNDDLTALGKIWAYLDGQPKQPIDLEPADTEEVDKLRSIVTDLANVIKKRRIGSRPKAPKLIQT